MYILIEMQTNNGQTALVQPRSYTDRLRAESAYYNALSAAAVSSIQVHTVVLLDEHGNTVKNDYYEHETTSK